MKGNTQATVADARKSREEGATDGSQARGLPLNSRSSGKTTQAALLQRRRAPGLQRWMLIKAAAMQFIGKQHIQGRRIRWLRQHQKRFTVIEPDQPPQNATLAPPTLTGSRSRQPLLPDLRNRCRRISLKALNQARSAGHREQLCCSTAIQGRRLQAGGAQQQDGQKKSTTPREELCRD